MKLSTIVFPVTSDEVYLALKKKGFGKGFLNGWGGKEENGENILQVATREFREESTALVNESDLEEVAIIDFFEGAIHLFECHVFFTYRWSGELLETEEMGRGERFSKKQLPLGRMWKGDARWLPLVCFGKKIRGLMFYEPGMKQIESFEHAPLT